MTVTWIFRGDGDHPDNCGPSVAATKAEHPEDFPHYTTTVAVSLVKPTKKREGVGRSPQRCCSCEAARAAPRAGHIPPKTRNARRERSPTRMGGAASRRRSAEAERRAAEEEKQKAAERRAARRASLQQDQARLPRLRGGRDATRDRRFESSRRHGRDPSSREIRAGRESCPPRARAASNWEASRASRGARRLRGPGRSAATSRGDAAAATWIFRADDGVAATPRVRAGSSAAVGRPRAEASPGPALDSPPRLRRG